MAQNEIVKILKVQTGDSQRTVKGLKDEISALKDALLNTEQGTQKYDDIVKQLRQDQEDLTRVMNASKQDVEALEGSYNHLVKTMAQLKKEWRATTSEARRNELGQQIDSINTKLKDMDASIGNYQRNVGNYADSFSQAMKTQQESTEVTRAKFESVSKVATGLASGYAAVQGAMALFGVENEKLAQTFVKLQAAIALAQGIGGLKDLVEGLGMAKVAFKGAVTGVKTFITSLRGVKAAIAGTGIGLLVVAVGMLVEHLMTLEDEAEDATDALEKLRYEQEAMASVTSKIFTDKQREAYAQYVVDVRNAKDNVELLVKAEEKLKQSLLDLQEAELKIRASDKQKAVDDFELDPNESVDEGWARLEKLRLEAAQAYNDLQKFYADKRKEEADAIIKAAEDEAERRRKEAERIASERAKAAEEEQQSREEVLERLEDLNKTAEQIELDNLKEKYEEEKQLLKGRNEDLLLLEQEYLQNRQAIIDEYAKEEKEKQLEALQNKYDNAMASIDDNQSFSEQETDVKYDGMETKDPVQAIQYEIDKLNELRELRIQFHNERLQQIDELLASELISAETRMELEREKANLIRENALEEQKYINETAKLEKKKEEEKKKIRQLQYSATLSVAKNTFESVAKLAKEGSTTQKALSIAATTIDTYQSATAAYKAMAGIPYVGPALGIAAAAAAVASGIANVKQILSVDAENGETSSPTGSGVSVTPSFNAEQAMPIEYTRNILTSAETDELNKPQRVYVLESDITETQNKVEVTENNATF